ncbi:MAG: amidohydrolase family protein [Clostridiales bacterium]|nr:amidohydrolase family protein [Clostridiales bacterium]
MKGYGYCIKSKKRIPALLLAFVMLTATFSMGGFAFADDSSLWGGDFDPAAALAKQGTYEAGKYYVFYNGNIYTKANDFDFSKKEITSANGKINSFANAEVVVSKGQWIEYAGNDVAGWVNAEGLAAAIGTAAAPGANAVWIDLGGATVIPGMGDSHLHFIGQGQTRTRIDIFWKPKAEIIAAVKAEVERLNNPDAWIVSGGFLQAHANWDPIGGRDVWPTKWDLDAVAPQNPVVLSHASGHARWANSRAMELAGIDKDGIGTTPNPAGGLIMRDEVTGEATGIFTGNARGLISSAVPPQTKEQQVEALYAAQQQCFSYGLTSIMDAGSGMSTYYMLEEAYEGDFAGDTTIDPLNSDDPLKIRWYFELRGSNDPVVNDYPDNEFRETVGKVKGDEYGRLIGAYGNRLTVRAVKTQADGALGSRSALFREPYSDVHTVDNLPNDYKGEEYTPRTYLKELMNRNIRSGFQVSIHAIGDGGNWQFVDVYNEIKGEILAEATGLEAADPAAAAKLRGLVEDNRMRPEHFQIVNPEDIRKAIVDHSMIPSMQFVHCTSDMNMVEDRIGPDRVAGAYAWRSILDYGGIIANGTDASVELLNPFHGLYAGATRVGRFMEVGRPGNAADSAKFKAEFLPGTKNFTDDSGWYHEERLTRAESLWSYTYGSAYANFEENFKGNLEKGFLADFVVIDRDYFDAKTCYDYDIKEINAVMTVLGGEIVYVMEPTEITTAELPAADLGEQYSANLSATGTENFMWSIVSADAGLEWAEIDEYRGTISGVPTASGTYALTVQAESYLGTATKELAITVLPLVKANLSVPAVSGIEGDVEFTLSISGAEDVLSVELEFEVDGSMLASKGVVPLSGFTAIDGIAWRSAGGSVWKGAVTLGYPAGDSTGFTSFAGTDIATFVFAPRAMGDATMKLTVFRVVELDGKVTQYVNAAIENSIATTNIDQLVYSKYDLNRDNAVDALDLGIMLLYCGFDSDSPNWSTLVKVNDSKGKGVTASMCDVNGDGVIDMLDLLDLFIHYTK